MTTATSILRRYSSDLSFKRVKIAWRDERMSAYSAMTAKYFRKTERIGRSAFSGARACWYSLLFHLLVHLASYSFLSRPYLFHCCHWCHGNVATPQIHMAHLEYCRLQMLPLHWQKPASHQLHPCNLQTAICLLLQSTLFSDRVQRRKRLLKDNKPGNDITQH